MSYSKVLSDEAGYLPVGNQVQEIGKNETLALGPFPFQAVLGQRTEGAPRAVFIDDASGRK